MSTDIGTVAGGFRRKNHSEYLGSCEKMTEAEALEKAEYLGLSQITGA
jgi:hypothetical protein